MKTTAEIWIDHQKAVITTVSAVGGTVSEVRAQTANRPSLAEGICSMARFEQDPVQAIYSQKDELLDQLNHFYSEVIVAIGDAMTVLIFGPGEAKTELGKRLRLMPVKARIHTMETSGSLTDRVIADRARDHLYN
jgi:hypothetical protein